MVDLPESTWPMTTGGGGGGGGWEGGGGGWERGERGGGVGGACDRGRRLSPARARARAARLASRRRSHTRPTHTPHATYQCSGGASPYPLRRGGKGGGRGWVVPRPVSAAPQRRGGRVRVWPPRHAQPAGSHPPPPPPSTPHMRPLPRSRENAIGCGPRGCALRGGAQRGERGSIGRRGRVRAAPHTSPRPPPAPTSRVRRWSAGGVQRVASRRGRVGTREGRPPPAAAHHTSLRGAAGDRAHRARPLPTLPRPGPCPVRGAGVPLGR